MPATPNLLTADGTVCPAAVTAETLRQLGLRSRDQHPRQFDIARGAVEAEAYIQESKVGLTPDEQVLFDLRRARREDHPSYRASLRDVRAERAALEESIARQRMVTPEGRVIAAERQYVRDLERRIAKLARDEALARFEREAA